MNLAAVDREIAARYSPARLTVILFHFRTRLVLNCVKDPTRFCIRPPILGYRLNCGGVAAYISPDANGELCSDLSIDLTERNSAVWDGTPPV